MLFHHENQNEKNQQVAPRSVFQDTKEVIFSNELALQFEIADERAEQASFYLSAHLDCLRSCPASPQINGKTTTDLNVSRAE